MRGIGGIPAKGVLLGLAVVIVAGGILVGLVSNAPSAGPPLAGPASSISGGGLSYLFAGLSGQHGSANYGATQIVGNGVDLTPGATDVINQGTVYTVTTTVSTTTSLSTSNAPSGNFTKGGSPASGSIEFSSQVALQSASPQQAASSVVALAYSVGGYVAFQSTYSSSANVVIRVPAADYELVLGKVEALGTVESLTSNSNDVSVQYTDLNATLKSLQTEQGALLRLLNESATINSTLAIESQLQGVNQQINEVESQILQTRTLIAYSTIDVTFSETAQQAPLSMVLTASPKGGVSPLSVTFNAVVKGGAQPYVVNYNFGDGYASEGQIVIHTYFQPGDFNVTVTATDQNGTSVEQSTMIHVSAAPGTGGFQGFIGSITGLFVSVIEGIAEVAVVVLPIAAVGAAVWIPLQRRSKSKGPKPE